MTTITTVQDIPDDVLLMELASTRDTIYQRQKDLKRADAEWLDAIRDDLDSLIAEAEMFEAERKRRNLNWTTKIIKRMWRKYGFNSRLYWKQNNPSWRWDSGVIAKCNGSHFLTREAIVTVCAYNYFAQQRKQRAEASA